MESYLVGGAVRDDLLGITGHERDFVVVGSTPEEMLAAGYRTVGKDFPVFLHPETGEEYALARTERKTGPGHQGFEVSSSPDTTLEEDLFRRDLTINAIARDESGQLIDPYGGIKDLDAGILRHVSPAFSEDPLRVLRLARFKARFHHLGFEVDKSTFSLVKEMVSSEQLAELAPERILMELDKALVTDAPAEFFKLLIAIGAHDRLWPEIHAAAVERLAERDDIKDPESRFALLLEGCPEDDAAGLCERLRCSRLRSDVTRLIAAHGATWRNLEHLDADAIVQLLYQLDALRKVDRFMEFNRICTEIFEMDGSTWVELRNLVASVKAGDLDTTAEGEALGDAITQEQVTRVQAYQRRGQNGDNRGSG